MSSDLAIRANRLGKVYRLYDRPEDRLKELIFRRRGLGRDFWALRDLDLEVRRGETIGVIGRNGSGKSTLLQIVCGTVQPTTGDLEVRGRVAALLELGAGFNPEFTGRENVHLSATVLGLSERDIAERFPAIEAFAEIGDFIDQPVRQYSSGMYARLAFAVCAHVDADILVVDEILAVGDTGFQLRCMRFLNAFRARGTLLFVSHDEGAVLSLCDRAIWLDQGIIRAAGRSKEVCARYRAFLSRGAVDGDEFVFGGAARLALDDAGPPAKPFDFDLDSSWVRSENSMIERVVLRRPGGAAADMVEGGGEVELRVEIRAARDLREPIAGFVLRNRLGQIIFGDDSGHGGRAPASIERGGRFATNFRFRLPHLPTGDYAIEPVLFERGGGGPIDCLLDSLFIRVNSNPALGGLANMTMRRKRLIIGDGLSARVAVALDLETASPVKDARPRRPNPIDVADFDRDAPHYGHGGARIVDAGFFALSGERLTRIQGGDEVELRIRAQLARTVERPIVGFMLRNSLGQNISGDNTAIGTPNEHRTGIAGETVTAMFRFQLPYLPVGGYSLVPSIVEERAGSRVHLHWMEDALMLLVADSPVVRGVVGVPMLGIDVDVALVEADDRAG